MKLNRLNKQYGNKKFIFKYNLTNKILRMDIKHNDFRLLMCSFTLAIIQCDEKDNLVIIEFTSKLNKKSIKELKSIIHKSTIKGNCLS